MQNSSVNAPIKEFSGRKKMVWFEGPTALAEGQGVCYNWDYGTATVADGRRFNRVELPSQTNAQYFAGVAAQAYAARTGGRMIEIYEPGSCCNILVLGVNCTIGTTGLLTCEAAGTYAGYFRYAGFPGRGSALVLQTVNRSSPAGCVFAYLQDGVESGLVETPALGTGGAKTFMVGGVTIFPDATNLSGGNATFTLADTVLGSGLRKMFKCMATMSTNAIVVTVTSGKQGVGNADPTTTLSTITMSADDHECSLHWGGTEANGHWYVDYLLGATLA